MAKAQPKLMIVTGNMPNEGELLSIPLAHTNEYELSDAECRKLRARIYALNKSNDAFRFRTLREHPILMVWKLRK